MAQDQIAARSADRARIDIDKDHDLLDWSQTFGVTRWELKAAVRKVGPLARDVGRALGSSVRI
jgi:hypothetical protein